METLLNVSAKKANMSFAKLVAYGILAGMFIGIGAYFSIIAGSCTDVIGIRKLLMGCTFPLGLIMVVIGGAELFTGNCLMWAGVLNNKISVLSGLFRNWVIVYGSNFIGALLVAVIAKNTMNMGAFGELAASIAEGKMNLSVVQMLLLGFMCNVLVCMAVYMCYKCDSTIAKIACCFFPVFGFVAMSFEHSIANMFYLPLGLMLGVGNCGAAMLNLLFVTLGNIAGGMFVAGMYSLAEGKND